MSGTTILKQTRQSPHLSSKFSFSGRKMNELDLNQKNGHTKKSYPSQRSRPACICSNPSGPVLCARHGYVVPEKRPTKRRTSQEILIRALSPPQSRRLTLRWLNFRPSPSRLSVMSMA